MYIVGVDHLDFKCFAFVHILCCSPSESISKLDLIHSLWIACYTAMQLNLALTRVFTEYLVQETINDIEKPHLSCFIIHPDFRLKQSNIH